jgi:hypothetical protein
MEYLQHGARWTSEDVLPARWTALAALDQVM